MCSYFCIKGCTKCKRVFVITSYSIHYTKLYDVRAAVGERFGVRNSGATAVVEGTGDNACEYMTGGIVVILGDTGVNFGAGMTGGLSFVYDPLKTFVDKMNQELIEAVRIDTDDTERERLFLKRLLMEYLRNNFV